MIHAKVDLSSGKVQVEVHAETAKEALIDLALFASLPAECPLCQAAVEFSYRRPEQFEYFGLRCRGPKTHETTFGVWQQVQGLFYKGPGSWREVPLGSAHEDDAPPAPREPAPRPQSPPQRAPAARPAITRRW